ncbi:MAG TPA: hypothetical protein VN577_02785 [Terriglobales bacterium]|nr:hypothetical protein [Terriglobales bacterium]
MSKDAKDRFPVLRDFARGYLHQDVVPEYGSPLKAASVYFADLGDEERRQLSREASKMERAAKPWDLDTVNRTLAEMGAAVVLSSTEEFFQILKVFRH